MQSPDFSESQLQSATNTAFAAAIQKRTGQLPFPFVPSLHAEFSLGWDTGFELSWLQQALPAKFLSLHKGCNFFLQYKLSSLIDSKISKREWAHWKAPYLRFRIPHRKKLAPGWYVDDFHQWDRLRDIAGAGVATFYATNSMIEESELRALFEAGNLLTRIALLDVATVKKRHVNVSFADPYSKFMLHSIPEEAPLIALSQIFDRLSNQRRLSFEEGVEQLVVVVEMLTAQDNLDIERLSIRDSLQDAENRYRQTLGRGYPGQYLRRSLLESYIARRYGIRAYWSY